MAANGPGAVRTIWARIAGVFAESERSFGNTLIAICLGVLLALSAFATAKGLIEVRLATSTEAVSILEMLFMVPVGMAMVALLYVSLHAALAERAVWLRALGAIGYLFFVVWTISFSFGFFWSMFQARDASAQNISRAAAPVMQSIQRASESLSAAAGELNQTAEFASDRANSERLFGNSCENTNSRPGQGVLATSLTAHAERLAEISVTASASAATISTNVQALNQTVAGLSNIQASDAQFVQASAQVRAAIESTRQSVNGEVQTFRGVARGLAVRATTLRQDSPSTNCKDTTLAASVDDVIRTINAIPTAAELGEIEEYVGSDATLEAFQRFTGWVVEGLRQVAALARVPVPPQPGDYVPPTEDDGLALFAALGIDFGILILSVLSNPRRTQRLFQIRRPNAESRARMKELVDDLSEQRPLELRRLLRRHIVEVGRKHYVVVPKLAEAATQAEIETILALEDFIVALEDSHIVQPTRREYFRDGLARILPKVARARVSRTRAIETALEEQGVAVFIPGASLIKVIDKTDRIELLRVLNVGEPVRDEAAQTQQRAARAATSRVSRNLDPPPFVDLGVRVGKPHVARPTSSVRRQKDSRQWWQFWRSDDRARSDDQRNDF